MKKTTKAIGLCAIFFAFALMSIGSGSSNTSTSQNSMPAQTSKTEATAAVNDASGVLSNTTEIPIEDKVSEISDALKDFTLGEKNAVKSAENYLSFTAFSYNGLINQLSSEYGDNYSVEEATKAVDYLVENGKVDWNEQAVKSAKNYLSFTAFSRDGLISQLSSDYGDKFTLDQATYAVDYLEENSLVDWNEQAVKSAQNYLSFTSFSKDGLIDQLSSDYGDKFTREQAEYAASAVGY